MSEADEFALDVAELQQLETQEKVAKFIEVQLEVIRRTIISES